MSIAEALANFFQFVLFFLVFFEFFDFSFFSFFFYYIQFFHALLKRNNSKDTQHKSCNDHGAYDNYFIDFLHFTAFLIELIPFLLFNCIF